MRIGPQQRLRTLINVYGGRLMSSRACSLIIHELDYTVPYVMFSLDGKVCSSGARDDVIHVRDTLSLIECGQRTTRVDRLALRHVHQILCHKRYRIVMPSTADIREGGGW